ncbi:MAG: hypothetical protein JXA13_03360 [Anaerolineales bacterium]|nr:hypothetical protein [Anaerolineales bacterium]
MSAIIERLSPRTTGILSGYPLGTAILLFFFGIENNTDFPADSAWLALLGMAACKTFTST